MPRRRPETLARQFRRVARLVGHLPAVRALLHTTETRTMAATKISWADYTFNGVIGCTKVSPGCAHCYAETWAQRHRPGGLVPWGNGSRVVTKGPWQDALKWQREAAASRVRARVFASSLSDVFEDHQVPNEQRPRFWQLVRSCRDLDWLVLTKRPENIARMLPSDWSVDAYPHVWLGTSVEDQQRAEERLPHLLGVPARVRFVSCEPLLGPVNLTDLPLPLGPAREGLRTKLGEGARCNPLHAYALDQLHWVICGGESGPGHRPMDLAWARSLRDQCAAHGTAYWFKQTGGAKPGTGEDQLDGQLHQAHPRQALPRS